jgi:hypothetical protein
VLFIGVFAMILLDINQFIMEDKHVELNLTDIHGENEKEERTEQ